MKQVPLGKSGPMVSTVGLGCMGMSGMYGPADRKESLATLQAAVDAGITLLDTGDFYGMGHNELLIGEALKTIPRDRVLLSVKFGALRDPAGAWLGYDIRPQALKTFLAYSLQRLGVDYVDIYRPARIDPQVPIEDTVGAIADMIKAGFVRHIGLSEIGVATLRRAAAVHPICDLQIEYSLISRGIEAQILPAARQLGVAITAYGVLARGLISGHWRKTAFAPGDFPRARAAISRAPTPTPTWRWSRRCAPWRRHAASRWRRPPLPGWRNRDPTSSRSSARGAASVSARRSAPSISISARRIWPP